MLANSKSSPVVCVLSSVSKRFGWLSEPDEGIVTHRVIISNLLSISITYSLLQYLLKVPCRFFYLLHALLCAALCSCATGAVLEVFDRTLWSWNEEAVVYYVPKVWFLTVQCPIHFLFCVPDALEVSKTSALACIDTDDLSHQNRSPPWEPGPVCYSSCITFFLEAATQDRTAPTVIHSWLHRRGSPLMSVTPALWR